MTVDGPCGWWGAVSGRAPTAALGLALSVTAERASQIFPLSLLVLTHRSDVRSGRDGVQTRFKNPKQRMDKGASS
jgi:hypothetical protein